MCDELCRLKEEEDVDKINSEFRRFAYKVCSYGTV